jgi:hypothetical protein
MDPVILNLLGVLKEMHEQKGVPKQDKIIEKNIVKSKNSTFDSDKREKRGGLSSEQKQNLVETFTLFNQMFFEFQKKVRVDEKEKTKVSQIAKANVTPPPLPPPPMQQKSEGGFGRFLLGGLAILGGLFTFIAGLMTDSSLKGVLKILSKITIAGGIKALTGILSKFGGIFGGMFDNVIKFAKSFVDDLGKGVASIAAKVLPKGGKGLFGKLGASIIKGLKPAAKLLKRIPIIGSLISVGFAISRFRSGDTVGGVIDVMSGLVGLLDLVVPGLGFGLSLGLDVLNAFLDIKAGGSNPKASKKKGDILWDMAKGLGAWIWSRAEYIPVLGTIKWFGKAYDSFKGGNYMDMLKNFGLGMFALIPGAGFIIKGVEMLMGFFSDKKPADPKLTENTSWFSKLKDWVKSKLQDLPWWIKKPLSWFGIMEDDSGINSNAFGDIGAGVKAGFEGSKKFFSGIWDTIKGPIGDAVGYIGKFASDTWSKTKDIAGKAWEGIKSIIPKTWDGVKNVASDAWSSIKENAPKAWEAVKDISGKAWERTKEFTSDAWKVASEEGGKLWESIKETSSKALEKAKEAGTWAYNAIESMASEAKTLIDAWVPKIVDTITGITDSALGILKGIADKIGSWVMGLVSPEDPEIAKVAPVKKSENVVNSTDTTYMENVAKNNIVSNKWLHMLHNTSLEQVKLLGMMVNIGNSSLSELKRISGNPNKGGTTTVISPPQQQSKTPSIPISNNRTGFASSPYALG